MAKNDWKIKLKKIIPSKIVYLIEQRHYISDVFSAKKALKNRKHEDGKKIKIVFIFNYVEAWNSNISIYRAAEEMGYDVSFLCLPKGTTKNGKFVSSKEGNEEYDFCVKNGVKSINACIGENQWFDLEKYAPDYVFYNRPYCHMYPKEYMPQAVNKYAKTCCVFYGAPNGSDKHLSISYNYEFCNGINIMFCSAKYRTDYCKKIFWPALKLKTMELAEINSACFDSKLYSNFPNNERKVICWIPRWNVGGNISVNNDSGFFKYYENLIDYMDKHPDLELIIRPHPLMFQTIVTRQIKTQAEVDQLIESINAKENVSFDQNTDYIDTFIKTDILIADFSSLITQFYMTGRPIIYCDNMDGITDPLFHKMYASLYTANNFSEMEKSLSTLSSGIDPNERERKSIVSEYSNGDFGHYGEKMIRYITEDYNRNKGEKTL